MPQCAQILDALMELILSAELDESDIKALYDKLQPHLRPFAEALGIARLEIRIDFAPNVYDLSGRGEVLSTDYFDDADGVPFVLTFPDLYMTTGTASIHPRAGVVWDDEAKRTITTVAKFLALQFSRMNMVNRIERLSYIDLFTGLANTQGVTHYGARIEKNYSLADYAGCFINLKNLRYINQQPNRTTGDAVIRQYALRLYGFMDHRNELVARLGGDNFFVLLRRERLERFLNLISALGIILNNGGERTRLTIEAWVGVYLANENDPVGVILTNAAFANEQAKHDRIPVVYFDPTAKEHMLHTRQIAHTLPDAMRTQELLAFYQPKVNSHTGDLCGGEALVRWFRDEQVVPPSEFVPAAEASGLITTLDLYMLDAVCADLRSWLDAGVEPVCISVNYSQHDFRKRSLIEDTIAIVDKYQIDGKYLEIEITETSFYENFQALDDFIRAMHARGIRVALDDFGTGYSSLNMLKTLDLDTIKLDKSFFDEYSKKDESDRAVLRSVADMIVRLNKTAVSEGIETADQIKAARALGCDVVQGYFFDKPLSYAEFSDRLDHRHYDSVPQED